MSPCITTLQLGCCLLTEHVTDHKLGELADSLAILPCRSTDQITQHLEWAELSCIFNSCIGAPVECRFTRCSSPLPGSAIGLYPGKTRTRTGRYPWAAGDDAGGNGRCHLQQ